MKEKAYLHPSLTLRPARWSDVDAVAKLTHDVAELEGDAMFVMTAEELADAWKADGFELERDVFLVETRDGLIVGSEEFYKEHHRLKADGCVHPDFRGKGIGSSLLEKAIQHASLDEDMMSIQSFMNNKDDSGHILLRENDFSPVRYFWRMEIKLQETPVLVNFPNGIELRPYIKDEHAHAAWQVNNEVFHDHWGSHEFTFDDWTKKFNNPGFDPTLWLVAWDGDEIAGFSQNRIRQGIGWVGTIGVRRPWRNKGLGIALLRHTFGEFYKRGIHVVGLGVDSDNLTGATRVYERAGMHVVSEHALYEKELTTSEKKKKESRV